MVWYPHKSCIADNIAAQEKVARKRKNKIKKLLRQIRSPNSQIREENLVSAVELLLKEAL